MPHRATYHSLLDKLYYIALFSCCCFYVPYEITLKRISGYGIATNPCNSRRLRSKGWILYAFLWWLPFVMGLIGGSALLTYFACENLFLMGVFLARVIPPLATAGMIWLQKAAYGLADVTAEICCASFELAGDICWVLAQTCKEAWIEFLALFKRPQEPEAEPQNTWEQAIIMPESKKSVHDSWQAAYEIGCAMRKMQDIAQRHERNEQKRQRQAQV